MYVCGVLVHMYMHMGVGVHYMWRSELNMRCLPFVLFFSF